MTYAFFCSSEIEIEQIITKIREGGLQACLLDPKIVYDFSHIDAAAAMARQAFEDEENISKDFNVEFMLWLTSKTQTGKCIEDAGAKDKKGFIFVSFTEEERKAIGQAKVLGINIESKKITTNTYALEIYGLRDGQGLLDLIENMALVRLR